MITFCWLPPLSVVIACPGRAEHISERSTYCEARFESRHQPAELVSRSSVAIAKFSRIDIQLKSGVAAALARHVGDVLLGRVVLGARQGTSPSAPSTTAPPPAAPDPEGLEEGLLAVALEPGEADQFAGRCLDARPAAVRREPQVAGADHDIALADGGRVGFLAACSVSRSEPVIRRTSCWRRPVAAVELGNRRARAHHRDAVADLLDLVHAVVMKMTPTPSRESSPTSSKSRSRVATSSAEVASSRIRIFGLPQQRADDAAGLAVRARAPRRPCSRSSVAPSSSVERRGAGPASRCSGTWRVQPVPSAPSQTLSSTEHDSATSTSWKTVKTPAALGLAGLRIAVSEIAVELEAAGVRRVDAAQDLDHGRLAAAVLADQQRAPRRAAVRTRSRARAWVAPKAFATFATRSKGAAPAASVIATDATVGDWVGFDAQPFVSSPSTDPVRIPISHHLAEHRSDHISLSTGFTDISD